MIQPDNGAEQEPGGPHQDAASAGGPTRLAPDGGTGSWPFRVLAVVAGLMAAVMMISTTIDVAGRYFFNSPLYGAFEITEITMGLIVFTALPLAVMRREMIIVSVVSDHYPPALRRAVDRAGLLLGVVLFGFMAWRLWVYGERLWRFREVTLELRVPKGLIVQTMSVLAAISAIACLFALIAAVRQRSGPPTIDRTA